MPLSVLLGRMRIDKDGSAGVEIFLRIGKRYPRRVVFCVAVAVNIPGGLPGRRVCHSHRRRSSIIASRDEERHRDQ